MEKRLTHHQAQVLKIAAKPDQVWSAFKLGSKKTVYSHNGNVVRSLVNARLLVPDYFVNKHGLSFIYYTSIQGTKQHENPTTQ